MYGAVQVRMQAFSVLTLGKGELSGFSRRSLYAEGVSSYEDAGFSTGPGVVTKREVTIAGKGIVQPTAYLRVLR